jgi:hypothetical protein
VGDELPAFRPLRGALRERARQTLREAVDAIGSDVRELPLAVRDVAHDLSPSAEQRARWRRRRPVTYPLLGTVVVSALALSLSALTGWWDVLRVAWPMALFFLAAVLSGVMVVMDLPLLLGVIGFLVGNGPFLYYSAATGHWRRWIVLSILDLVCALGCAWGIVWLRRSDAHAHRLSRALGRPLALALFLTGLALLGLSIVLSTVALVKAATTG